MSGSISTLIVTSYLFFVYMVLFRFCFLGWVGGYLPLFGHEEQDGDEADNEEGRYDGEDDDQVVKDAVISCKKKTGALKTL